MMDDGGSRQGRRVGTGGLRPMVVEATGCSEVYNNGDAGPTRLCVGRTKKIRASVHKIEVMSRRLGSMSRRCRGHILHCHDVGGGGGGGGGGVSTDVATLEPTSQRYRRGSNGDQSTSRCSGSTLQRERGGCFQGSFNFAML